MGREISPKRPRTEEGLEEGFEKKEQVTERPEKDFKMAVAEESDDYDDEEEVEADEDYTPEDLERDSKNFYCKLCKKYGHFASLCPWKYLCPSDVEIPPSYERICCCCGDIVDRAHPDTPYDDIPFRAASKRHYRPPERRHWSVVAAQAKSLSEIFGLSTLDCGSST